MKDAKPLKGLDWRGGAIGNARWGGALLSEVLKEAGFSMEECQKARHVIFEGLDVEPDNSLFGGSITIEKATDPRGDVLLAYEMNGEPLPRCCTPVPNTELSFFLPGTTGSQCVQLFPGWLVLGM